MIRKEVGLVAEGGTTYGRLILKVAGVFLCKEDLSTCMVDRGGYIDGAFSVIFVYSIQ